jgi:hypothetical protein
LPYFGDIENKRSILWIAKISLKSKNNIQKKIGSNREISKKGLDRIPAKKR